MRQVISAVLCALGALLALPGGLLAYLGSLLYVPPAKSTEAREAEAAARIDAAVAGLPIASASRALNSAYYRAVTLPTADAQERAVGEAMRQAGAIVLTAATEEPKH